MKVLINPGKDEVDQLIEQSEMKAAKWLKDLDTGDYYYWSSDWEQHASVANDLKLNNWDKGIVT